MRSRSWVILFGALGAVLLGAALLLRSQGSGHVARIYQDNACIRTVDLAAVTEPFTFTVTDDQGHENTVEVEPGRIRVCSANCPDQVCVNTGWISGGRKPIVCLPAHLVIRVGDSEEDAVDAVAG